MRSAENTIMSRMSRIDGRIGKIHSFWATYSLRMSACTAPERWFRPQPRASATATHIANTIEARDLAQRRGPAAVARRVGAAREGPAPRQADVAPRRVGHVLGRVDALHRQAGARPVLGPRLRLAPHDLRQLVRLPRSSLRADPIDGFGIKHGRGLSCRDLCRRSRAWL